MVTRQRLVLLAILGAFLLGGCSNLEEQPKLAEPYDSSPLFGSAARDIDPNAVAVDHLEADTHLYAGQVNGEFVDTFPSAVTADDMANGQVKYEAFCTPCHGYSGYGDGVVVAEGLQQMRSFHDPELVAEPAGYYFDVITNGLEGMYSYGSRIEAEDRWDIVAYIRALQLSQNANLDDLPQDVQDEFNAQTSQ